MSTEGAAVIAGPDGWYRTRIDPFTYATWVDGRCWVLRLNGFPDHPLHTLFVDGAVVGDVEELPASWARDPARPLPELDPDRRAAVIDLMAALGPYNSENGAPCDGDWCTCRALTEERVRTYVSAIDH